MKISILDQSLIGPDETPEDALANTVLLAQQAEEWGYERFWVSEHHNSEKLAGSSPEVLISYLLAKTSTLRIGSGGVMLQHYSPYKVAENFNVLSALAPGRVDLGIGKAPGGLQLSTKALQGNGEPGHLGWPEKITELLQFTHDDLPDGHPLSGVKATPVPLVPANVFLLGASADSATHAAKQGLPYVFAQFINSDKQTLQEAANAYAKHYIGEGPPHFILALFAIAADTDEEAESLVSDRSLVKIKFESGRTLTVGSLEQAEAYASGQTEPYSIDIQEALIHTGSKETIYRRLTSLSEIDPIQELMIVTPVGNFEKKSRSYQLINEAFSLLAAVE